VPNNASRVRFEIRNSGGAFQPFYLDNNDDGEPDGGTVTFTELQRPATGGGTTTLSVLVPTGTYTFLASAFPSATGANPVSSGQAAGVAIKAGEDTPFAIVMDSTFSHLQAVIRNGSSTGAVLSQGDIPEDGQLRLASRQVHDRIHVTLTPKNQAANQILLVNAGTEVSVTPDPGLKVEGAPTLPAPASAAFVGTYAAALPGDQELAYTYAEQGVRKTFRIIVPVARVTASGVSNEATGAVADLWTDGATRIRSVVTTNSGPTPRVTITANLNGTGGSNLTGFTPAELTGVLTSPRIGVAGVNTWITSGSNVLVANPSFVKAAAGTAPGARQVIDLLESSFTGSGVMALTSSGANFEVVNLQVNAANAIVLGPSAPISVGGTVAPTAFAQGTAGVTPTPRYLVVRNGRLEVVGSSGSFSTLANVRDVATLGRFTYVLRSGGVVEVLNEFGESIQTVQDSRLAGGSQIVARMVSSVPTVHVQTPSGVSTFTLSQ
jgi:hypothetical protein